MSIGPPGPQDPVGGSGPGGERDREKAAKRARKEDKRAKRKYEKRAQRQDKKRRKGK